MPAGESKDTMGKEGVDWEWRTAKSKNGGIKMRHRFTAAEKASMAKPAPKPAASSKAATTKAVKKPVAKDPMKGYRKGDVTTSPLPSDIAAATRSALADTKPKSTIKMPERPVTPTRSKTATGRYSEYETARLGGITEAQWDAMTAAQREAKGLPVSWMDYVRSGGDSAVRAPKVKAKPLSQYGSVTNPRASGAGSYAKGGMVTKKGKC